MGDFGNGVEQFSEHFQVRCRVSLLIGYSTDFFRAAPIFADSIDSFAQVRSGSKSEIHAINKLSILSFLWHRMQNITHGI
jgi:hypothetical protein